MTYDSEYDLFCFRYKLTNSSSYKRVNLTSEEMDSCGSLAGLTAEQVIAKIIKFSI